MNRKDIKNKQGFTIIEVVLVLGIAGLIFLMVFVAFPALQRAQRDTQRTDSMGTLQAALINWQNNHSGNLPAPTDSSSHVDFDSTLEGGMMGEDGAFTEGCTNIACQFVRDYLNSAATQSGTNGRSINTFKDPDGEFYNVVITKNIAHSDVLSGVSFNNKDFDATIQLTGSSANVNGQTTTAYTLSGPRDAYAIFVIPGATCYEDKAIESTKNNFALLYRMEGSGVKCTNNGS